ncbi:MAG TPA: histidine kinase [Lentisphaeria bacterium]|nr:MAG: hypothetical protein A2X45_21730 [Lentisphaerae bacterium GWF2_50_93]HCE42765.1 histidine kinase [Lentisphaeria bacterium]
MIFNSQFKTAGTKFAPPERSSDLEVKHQGESIAKMSLVCGLLNAMPDFVMILNQNRQIVFGNKAVAEFAMLQGCSCYFGLRPGELVSCQHAASAESGCGTTEACKTCGAVLSILQSLQGLKSTNECRIIRLTGKGMEPLDMRALANPFMWEGKMFCLLILTDISNEKRRKVLERIFFHDVLNTAGSIWSISELLNAGAVTADEVKKDLYSASSQLIDEIVSQRQLLAAESNELAVNMIKMESLEFLNSVMVAFRNHEVAKHKRILVDKGSENFEFVNDQTLLFRIIGNLLKNALEASGENETVMLGAGRKDGEYYFWCHNAGVMPEEVKLQIFQRSYSTKGQGRGIGTYSIKLLAERYLHGKVSFISDKGKGTTFTVTFIPE